MRKSYTLLRGFRGAGQSHTQTSYYVYDGHGSTRALTDPNGAVTDTYDYDAFGNLLHSTATGIPPGGTTVAATPNEFLFAGEQLDSDLSLYYNRARYLNVSTGRFWTIDSYAGDDNDPPSLHRYLYASAEPVNRLDPSGQFDFADITIGQAVFAVLVGAATLGLIAYHLFHSYDLGLYFNNDFYWQDQLRSPFGPRQALSPDQISTVKQYALQSLRTAFAGFTRVHVHEGRAADHTVEIVTDMNKCGRTVHAPASYSFVSYACALNGAELAFNNSDPKTGLAALGWGIGSIAAHEIGHQLNLSVVNTDAVFPGKYDSVDSRDPANYVPGVGLGWTDQSQQELKAKLN